MATIATTGTGTNYYYSAPRRSSSLSTADTAILTLEGRSTSFGQSGGQDDYTPSTLKQRWEQGKAEFSVLWRGLSKAERRALLLRVSPDLPERPGDTHTHQGRHLGSQSAFYPELCIETLCEDPFELPRLLMARLELPPLQVEEGDLRHFRALQAQGLVGPAVTERPGAVPYMFVRDMRGHGSYVSMSLETHSAETIRSLQKMFAEGTVVDARFYELVEQRREHLEVFAETLLDMSCLGACPGR